MTKKKIATLTATAFAASAIIPVAAFAAEDIQLEDGVYIVGQYYSLEDFQALTKAEKKQLIKDVVSKNAPFVIITNGNLYDFADPKVQEGDTLEGLDITKAEYEEKTGNVITQEGIQSEDTQVTSVKAINQTVDKAGTLKFSINNGEELTVAELNEKFKDQGYVVTFKADKAVFEDAEGTTSNTGKLAVNLDGKDSVDFEYEVVIKDAKNNEVAKSTERGKVTAENQKSIVTSIDRVEVKVNSKESTTIAKGQTATIQVFGHTKDMKADAEAANITEKADFTVTPTALATGAKSNDNATYTVTPTNDRKGEVTVTIKIAGQKDQVVKLQVTNEARKVDAEKSSVVTKDVKLATGTTETIEVILLDQYGEPVTGKENEKDFFKLEGLNGVTQGEVEAVDKKDGHYTVELTAGDKAVKGAVTVKADKEEIGKVNVEVQEAGEVATWELKPSIEEIDLKGKKANSTQEVGFEIIAKDKNGLTVKEHGKEVVVKLKDTELTGNTHTVNLKDVKKGDVLTFELYEKRGALEDALNVKAEVKVVDTTPTLETVELADPSKVAGVKVDDDITKLVKNIVAKTEDGKAVETELVVEGDALVIKEKVAEGAEAVTLGTIEVDNATVDKDGKVTEIEDYTKPVTLSVIELDGTVSQEKVYDLGVFKADKAVLTVETEEVTEAAKAAKATIDGVKFEAVNAGKAGNNISIKIEQGTADTENQTVKTSVTASENKVTITLGATWDTTGNDNQGESKPTEVKPDELVKLINETASVNNIIKASVNEDKKDEAVKVTGSTTELQDGSDATTETVTKSKTLEVTFSEAVKLEGDFGLTVKGKTATVAKGTTPKLSKDGKTVTITLDTDSTIVAKDTITAITGVKAAKGDKELTLGEGLEVKEATEED